MSFLIRITLKGQTDRDLGAFEQAVCRVPEVAECYLTTGESDYLLRVVARSAADFERLHSKVLTKLPGAALESTRASCCGPWSSRVAYPWTERIIM